MLQDFAYALRRLRSQPGYAAAGVLALALGIACTTAIFSVMQAVLLRTLPVPHPERLVSLWEDQTQVPDASISGPDFRDLKAQASSFESISASVGMSIGTFAAVVVLLLGAALLACWIPARRASRVDPLIALRAE